MSTVFCEEDRICKMFADGLNIEQISKVIYSERASSRKVNIKVARQIVESVLLTNIKEENHDKKVIV